MRDSGIKGKIFNGLSVRTVLSFFITIGLCSVIITLTVINRSNVEKLTMEQIIVEKSIEINEVITRLLYKTHILSAIIVQSHGVLGDFEVIAAPLVDDPSILNILIAPGGVVSDVYPKKGNEAVIGLNFFADGAGNSEAVMAVETRQLILGGPFDLVQGGQALVGRLPVYTYNNEGEIFWGLVSVTLKYPQALESAGLSSLQNQGYAYEIWRTNPDNNMKQIIASSNYAYNKNARYIERYIPILNADWYCRISPVRNWYNYPETWILCFVSLLVGVLVAYVVQCNYELNLVKSELESLAQSDSLTGIFNRRHFMEQANIQLDRLKRIGGTSFVIMFDLDHFKNTNDENGHPAGDEVLKTIASVVKNSLRPYDLFARYGGEEFIIFVTDMNIQSVKAFTERLRKTIQSTAILYEHKEIFISASFGISQAAPLTELEHAVKLADEAMYRAKSGGRNQTVFYGDTDI